MVEGPRIAFCYRAQYGNRELPILVALTVSLINNFCILSFSIEGQIRPLSA
jgi:hypothetical protein